MRKRRVQNDTQVSGLNNRKDEAAINRDREIAHRTDFGWGNQKFGFGNLNLGCLLDMQVEISSWYLDIRRPSGERSELRA